MQRTAEQRRPARKGKGGGGGGARGSRVAYLNFKRSRVGVMSMFHVAGTIAVGNLKKGRRLSRFHFKCCRYFLGHVACQNLPCRASTKYKCRFLWDLTSK